MLSFIKEGPAVAASRLPVEQFRYELTESDLTVLAKGGLRKIEIAQRLREETVVAVKWIAERLSMGSEAYGNNRLHRKRKGKL